MAENVNTTNETSAKKGFLKTFLTAREPIEGIRILAKPAKTESDLPKPQPKQVKVKKKVRRKQLALVKKLFKVHKAEIAAKAKQEAATKPKVTPEAQATQPNAVARFFKARTPPEDLPQPAPKVQPKTAPAVKATAPKAKEETPKAQPPKQEEIPAKVAAPEPVAAPKPKVASKAKTEKTPTPEAAPAVKAEAPKIEADPLMEEALTVTNSVANNIRKALRKADEQGIKADNIDVRVEIFNSADKIAQDEELAQTAVEAIEREQAEDAKAEKLVSSLPWNDKSAPASTPGISHLLPTSPEPAKETPKTKETDIAEKLKPAFSWNDKSAPVSTPGGSLIPPLASAPDTKTKAKTKTKDQTKSPEQIAFENPRFSKPQNSNVVSILEKSLNQPIVIKNKEEIKDEPQPEEKPSRSQQLWSIAKQIPAMAKKR